MAFFESRRINKIANCLQLNHYGPLAELYLQAQIVPLSKHRVSVKIASRLMLHM
jgi:hypothetical protein